MIKATANNWLAAILSVPISCIISGVSLAQQQKSPADDLIFDYKKTATAQEKWEEKILDPEDNYHIRNLSKSQINEILNEARLKSLDKSKKSSDRAKWLFEYKHIKWELAFIGLNRDEENAKNIQELNGILQAAKNLRQEAYSEYSHYTSMMIDKSGKFNYNSDFWDWKSLWGMNVERIDSVIKYIPTMSDVDIWQNRFRLSSSKSEKLSLLQEAWDKSQSESLSAPEREYWARVWSMEYEREAGKVSMPNPYEKNVSGRVSCHKTDDTIECKQK